MQSNSLPDFSSHGYQAIAVLGQNRHGGRITYLAVEIASDRQVVIKQFEFGQNYLSWSSQEALESDRLNFSWGYRSNWRDPHVRKLLTSSNVNLANLLREGRQQSVFNSFFLYLHHQQQLIPLLNRLHGERGDGIDRIEQIFNRSIPLVDRDWRTWLETEALSLPMVESSFVIWEDRVSHIEKYLQKYWLWDNTKQMWIVPPKSSWNVIPALF